MPIRRTISASAVIALLAGAMIACGGDAGTTAVTPVTPVTPVVPTTSTWVQVWSDEFDGPAGAAVDSTKWSYDLGDGCPGICGWGNQEKEYYTSAPANIALDGNGALTIVAQPAPAGMKCYYGACRYTSAKIHTHGKMTAAPGRVEARIKLPAGQGLWPAFWMLGNNFPTTPWPACGEFDIMENKGSNPLNTSSAIHGPGYFGNTPFAHSTSTPTGTFADGFHVFSVEWDANQVAFSVDGAVHYVVTAAQMQHYGNSVANQSYFVILNLAVGGQFDGDPKSDAILPATMVVDYVRVYKLETK